MTLLNALFLMVTPLVARVIFALGFSIITIAGLQAAMGEIRARLFQELGGAPLAALQLAGLAGVWDGLAYVLGSVVFTLALWAITKAVRIGKPG